MKYLTLSIVFLMSAKILAQETDTISPWTLGIGVGYYMADDNTANFYNGSDNNRLNYILNEPNTRAQIRDALGGYEFELAEYAQDMTYRNTGSFELQIAYNFGKNWNISLHFHNVRLTASGIFTLRVDRMNDNNTTEPYLEQANISGTETRSHIDLGFGKRFDIGSGFYVPAEIGFDLNFTEVKENIARIAGRNFSLGVYNDFSNRQATITTSGTGIYASTGIGYKFPDDYAIILKMTYFQTQIDLNKVIRENGGIVLPGFGFVKSF